mmetsp:Transcript_52348/g.113444  ORF Transcript_52348/g.113444 Transcript_52348/m.113444 type:complete len:231 (+) Transcript_52348:26-718(+)
MGMGLTASRKAGGKMENSLGALAHVGRKTILCFGDSLTAGYRSGGRPDTPYSDRLACRLEQSCPDGPPEVVNAGISGETTAGMLKRLPRLLRKDSEGDKRLLDTLPDVVLILGGTNDLARGQSPEQIVQNLRELHSLAHEAGAVTGVITIPEFFLGPMQQDHFREPREQVNAALRSMASEKGQQCFLVDLAIAFPQAEHPSLWDHDGVHFSSAGSSAFGDLLADARLPSI